MYMSAPILQWPRKLHAVSDDMESFVHVTGVMALRFCLHNRSPIETNARTGEMKLNPKGNKALSDLVNFQYLQQYPDEADRYELGGTVKLSALQLGRFEAPFTHGDSPISTLLKGFYTALQPFYSKIDREEWDRRYAAYSNEDPSESEGTSLDALVPVNHDLLLDVFTKVRHSKTVKWNSIPPKTPDQFKGLRDRNGRPHINATAGATKRLLENNDSDDDSRPKKRLRV